MPYCMLLNAVACVFMFDIVYVLMLSILFFFASKVLPFFGRADIEKRQLSQHDHLDETKGN